MRQGRPPRNLGSWRIGRSASVRIAARTRQKSPCFVPVRRRLFDGIGHDALASIWDVGTFGTPSPVNSTRAWNMNGVKRPKRPKRLKRRKLIHGEIPKWLQCELAVREIPGLECRRCF